MANESFRPITAQDLIKMYNLDALLEDRKKTKTTSEKIKVLEETSNSLKDFAEEVEKQIEDLEKIADGKITTYYYSGVPTLNNFPANEWAVEEYENHIGDMYYDKETGYAYKFLFDNETNQYLWRQETNPELTEALAKANNALETANTANQNATDAKNTANSASNKADIAQNAANLAQTTANSKMQIFVDIPHPYPPYQVGDLWLKDDKVIYRCRAEKESGSYDENDWKPATDFTNDDYAKNVEEQLNSYKETVSTDYVLKTTFEDTNEGFAQEVESTTTKMNEIEISIDATNQVLNETLNKVVTKTEIEEVKKSVTQLQTDSFTKTEIKKIVSGTYFDENGDPVTVSALKSTSAKFDEDGMHYAQSGAKTGSTINHLGLEVNEVTQVNGVSVEGNDLLFAGYVDETKVDSTKPNYNAKLKDFEGQSVVYTRNVITDNYFVIGSHSRLEDYEDGTGIFYIGG